MLSDISLDRLPQILQDFSTTFLGRIITLLSRYPIYTSIFQPLMEQEGGEYIISPGF